MRYEALEAKYSEHDIALGIREILPIDGHWSYINGVLLITEDGKTEGYVEPNAVDLERAIGIAQHNKTIKNQLDILEFRAPRSIESLPVTDQYVKDTIADKILLRSQLRKFS